MERRTAVKLVLAAGAVPLLASAIRRAERLFAPGRPIVDDPITGFLAGSLTRRSVQFG
jgi:hypothetical protein